ncbi:Bridging integrator [Entamoeba marina]
MSGIGDAFGRKFYQMKTHVGAGQKTQDSDLTYSRTRLTEAEKKFKGILGVISKLPATIHATNLMQVEVLTSLGDVLPEGTGKQGNVSGVISTFQRIDEGVTEYEMRVENDITIPLKTYLEQYTILKKRFDICHNRRVDMDRYHSSVLSIAKKPPGKQTGLADAQNKYNVSRDLYNYLRDELINDVQRLTEDSDQVISPIVGTLVVAYTQYLNHLNQHWGAASSLASSFTIAPVDPSHVITVGESSMIVDANVFSKKSSDVVDGTYQDDDSYSPSTQHTSQPAPTRRAPPPTPQRGGVKKEQVRCEYDYDAQEQGELTIREELNGAQGYFPSNYVTPI